MVPFFLRGGPGSQASPLRPKPFEDLSAQQRQWRLQEERVASVRLRRFAARLASESAAEAAEASFHNIGLVNGCLFFRVTSSWLNKGMPDQIIYEPRPGCGNLDRGNHLTLAFHVGKADGWRNCIITFRRGSPNLCDNWRKTQCNGSLSCNVNSNATGIGSFGGLRRFLDRVAGFSGCLCVWRMLRIRAYMVEVCRRSLLTSSFCGLKAGSFGRWWPIQMSKKSRAIEP